LGLDEEPSPSARPMHLGMPARVPAARATADQGARKRRGIFGR
jgi:hypothetical protein